MIVYSVITVILFLTAFKNVRERVVPKSAGKSLKFTESLRSIKGNWPWILMTLMGIVFSVGGTMKNSSIIYYLEYNLNRPDLVSVFTPITMLSAIPAIALVLLITRFIRKRNTLLLGFGFLILGSILMWAAGPTSVALLLTGSIVGGLGMGFGAGVMFSMIADTVDYGE